MSGFLERFRRFRVRLREREIDDALQKAAWTHDARQSWLNTGVGSRNQFWPWFRLSARDREAFGLDKHDPDERNHATSLRTLEKVGSALDGVE